MGQESDILALPKELLAGYKFDKGKAGYAAFLSRVADENNNSKGRLEVSMEVDESRRPYRPFAVRARSGHANWGFIDDHHSCIRLTTDLEWTLSTFARVTKFAKLLPIFKPGLKPGCSVSGTGATGGLPRRRRLHPQHPPAAVQFC